LPFCKNTEIGIFTQNQRFLFSKTFDKPVLPEKRFPASARVLSLLTQKPCT
jgi:hypothetical protein